MAVVVVGASVVVEVVGVSLVVDGAVLVSGAVDDGGLLVGAWVSLTFDDVAGAGVVLTLGVGVLPDVWRMVISTPAPPGVGGTRRHCSPR